MLKIKKIVFFSCLMKKLSDIFKPPHLSVGFFGVLLIFIVSFANVSFATTNIAIIPNALTVGVGVGEPIEVTFTPSDTADTKVKWTSNNDTKASVQYIEDYGYVVIGKKPGEVIITATHIATGLIATCKVTVTANEHIAPILPSGTPVYIKSKKSIEEYEISSILSKTNRSNNNFVLSNFDADLRISPKKNVIQQAYQKIEKGTILEMICLPVVSVLASAKSETVAFSVPLLTEEVPDNIPFENAKIFILNSSSNGKILSYTNKSAEFGDGKWTLMTVDDQIVNEDLGSETDYKIVMFIKDGGEFDSDGTENSEILNIASAIGISGTSPVNNNLENLAGCNTMQWTPFLFIIFFPFLFLRKNFLK